MHRLNRATDKKVGNKAPENKVPENKVAMRLERPRIPGRMAVREVLHPTRKPREQALRTAHPRPMVANLEKGIKAEPPTVSLPGMAREPRDRRLARGLPVPMRPVLMGMEEKPGRRKTSMMEIFLIVFADG